MGACGHRLFEDDGALDFVWEIEESENKDSSTSATYGSII